MSIGMSELLVILPVCLVLSILVFVFAGVLVGGLVRRMTRKGPPMPGTVDYWAQNCYGLWTGGEDSGQWEEARARQSLQSWYGATDRAGFDRVIAGLKMGTTGNPAWDLVRAVDLLRIAVAAGYMTNPECWAEVRSIAKTLREAYGSWEELATGFEQGMHAWQDSRNVMDPNERGRVQRNLPTLRAYLWPRAAWGARL